MEINIKKYERIKNATETARAAASRLHEQWSSYRGQWQAEMGRQFTQLPEGQEIYSAISAGQRRTAEQQTDYIEQIQNNFTFEKYGFRSEPHRHVKKWIIDFEKQSLEIIKLAEQHQAANEIAGQKGACLETLTEFVKKHRAAA
ncbi:MAG: hypothetical protein KJ725_14400 [Gammaproteobacteria bacterium]|nr:hypothetical protein [Gammaproteobacteria bacterium]